MENDKEIFIKNIVLKNAEEAVFVSGTEESDLFETTISLMPEWMRYKNIKS